MTKSEVPILFFLTQNFCGLHQDFLSKENKPRVSCAGFGPGLVGGGGSKSLEA